MFIIFLIIIFKCLTLLFKNQGLQLSELLGLCNIKVIKYLKKINGIAKI